MSRRTCSEIRTSYGMFFDRGEVPSIRSVERKLSEWSLIPEGHGEGIQVGGGWAAVEGGGGV